jgi:hypothetical protein
MTLNRRDILAAAATLIGITEAGATPGRARAPDGADPAARPQAAQGPSATGDRTIANSAVVTLGGQDWQAQTGTPDGVSVNAAGRVRFVARTGERASFDPPRKIRAELCGQQRYEKGEPIRFSGAVTVDRASTIRGTDWCSLIQIHQADPFRADGRPVMASPLFAVDLTLDRAGRPILRARGETGTGRQWTFAPQRVLGTAPFTFGVEHDFALEATDGHGGAGRLRFLLDGRAVCDLAGSTGYEYVDLLADALPGRRQQTGSYLKMGVYAGKGAGTKPPPGVFVACTFRDLRTG